MIRAKKLFIFVLTLFITVNLFASIRSTTSYFKTGIPSSNVSNVTWDSTNKYASFSGSTSYVKISNPFSDFSIDEGLTFKMDVYVDTTGNNGWERFFEIADNETNIQKTSHFTVFANSGSRGSYMFCDAGQSNKVSSGAINTNIDDKWVTYELVIGPGGYSTVYVDGKADVHLDPSTYVTDVLKNLKNYTLCYLGESIYHAYNGNSDGYFKGKMKNVEFSLGTNRPVIDSNGNYLYTVNFDSNGGSAIKDLAVNKLPDVNSQYVPTKAGCEFIGWYTDSELKNKAVTDFTLSSEITLYAKWRPEPKFVSSSGSDTNGDGTLSKPFATITKAYSSLSSAGGAIALLSDINLNSTLAVSDSKNVLITSANSDGSYLDNEAGNYSGVYTIHRGSHLDNMFTLKNATLDMKQVIIDGDQKTVSSFIVSVLKSDNSKPILTLDTNSILKNNISTGNGGSNRGSGVMLGEYNKNGSKAPEFYMKSNAKITGCIAPRHGGALTVYQGDAFMQDDSSMQYNGVDFDPSYTGGIYYGGGAVLLFGGDLYMSGNASITKNFVQLNGGDDEGKQHNSMQVDPEKESQVYISGNSKIFDNYDDGKLTYNSDGTYKLIGTKQANSYASASAYFINGTMGNNSKVGVTISGATNGMTVIQATGSYSLTDADANAFFEDSGTYKFYRDGNVIKLSTQIDNVVLKLISLNSTKLLGCFDLDFSPSTNDFSIYKNGVKMDSGYTITVNGKNLSVTFDTELALNTKIGVSVSKNGYKVNNGKIVEKNYGHNHDWKFTAIGSVIKAVCLSQDSYVADCNFNGEENAMYFGITAGGNMNLGVNIVPSNATNKNLNWISSNPNVLTVDKNGKIHGKGEGTATITALATDGSNQTINCVINIHQ